MVELGRSQVEELGPAPNAMTISTTSAKVLNRLVGNLTAGLDSSWKCSSRGEFFLKSWQDGVVVFNEADGELQCLTPAYGQIFELLASGKVWTSFDVTRNLLAEEPSADDLELVENALSALASSNLIVRVPV